MSCGVMAAFQKKEMGEEQGITALTWGLHQWRRMGVLTCYCRDEESSCVCFSIRLLVEQRISSIKDIFILQNLMKCLGKDAPVFLKKKLEVKLVVGSFLLSQSLCSCIVYKLCMVLRRHWRRKSNRMCCVHHSPAISGGRPYIWSHLLAEGSSYFSEPTGCYFFTVQFLIINAFCI